jgi:hypothetical protein
MGYGNASGRKGKKKERKERSVALAGRIVTRWLEFP